MSGYLWIGPPNPRGSSCCSRSSDLEDKDLHFGPGFTDLPFASRAKLDVFREAFDDPTSLVWSADRVAEHVRQLDGELSRIEGDDLRCWLLEQRAKWTPPPTQRALLERWLTDEGPPSCA